MDMKTTNDQGTWVKVEQRIHYSVIFLNENCQGFVLKCNISLELLLVKENTENMLYCNLQSIYLISLSERQIYLWNIIAASTFIPFNFRWYNTLLSPMCLLGMLIPT